MARSGSSQLVPLLVLVTLLGGAGTWNYRRNVEVENAELRPYRTLADADLALLLAAAEQEAEALSGRYATLRQQRAPKGQSGAARPSARFRDFEQAQSHGRAVRELGYRASEREATLEELRREQGRRAGEGGPMQVFLRRLLTLPI